MAISPVGRARIAIAALTVVAVSLAVVDVVFFQARTGPRGVTAPGCGSDSRPRTGLLWQSLTDGRTTALVSGGAGGLNHPAVSPDGRMIAFLSHSNGIVATLHVCDLVRHTNRALDLRVPAGDFPLSWGRRGRTLLFLGGDFVGYGADQRPFAVDPSGKGLRQLAGDSAWYWDGAALSPDGRKLALLLQWKYPDGQEPEQLAALDLRTGKLERIAGSAQVAEIDAFSWSPDGRRIVLSAYRSNPRGGLYVVDTATKRLTPLLLRGAGAADPAWSPDGRSIAFVRRRGRSRSIWVLDLATGRTRQLTRGGDDIAPTWSSDGRAVVFVRRALTG